MPISRRRPAILVTLCLAGGLAEADERPLPRPATGTSATVAAPLLTPVQVPVYGTRDYRVTVVAAADFASVSSDFSTSVDTATLSRYCWGWCLDYGQHYYATLDVPAGAIIDYIGVNTATTGDAVMGFSLLSRDPGGGVANLATFSFPAHGFQTDFAGPLDIPVPAHHDRALILDVEQAPSQYWQYFGYVEVWWRLTVSAPPSTPTFGDVPATHPFYQYVEALAGSGITGGCGDGNFCPDTPLTRGQLAVFLAKALGLHWPY